MALTSKLYLVRQCPLCSGDTTFTCLSCKCEMCNQCKEIHCTNQKTMDHKVVLYRDKLKCRKQQEIYVRPPDSFYEEFLCNMSDLSFYFNCMEYVYIEIMKLRNEKQPPQRQIIHTIRREILLNRHFLYREIKSCVKICIRKGSLYQQDVSNKTLRLKKHLEKALRHVNFKHRCKKQSRKMNMHIASIQKYEDRFEQSAFSPVQFLRNKSIVSMIQDSPILTIHTNRLFMNEALNKKDVMEPLSAFHITERGKRYEGNKHPLKLMPCPELHNSFTIKNVFGLVHVSFLTSNRVWVSERQQNLIMTNTKGDFLYQRKDLCNSINSVGLHTLNGEGDLIYIDNKYNINKLSKYMIRSTPFIQTTDSTWTPLCVCWSPSTGDILVGMSTAFFLLDISDTNPRTGKISRYNQAGQLIQTMQHNNKGLNLYRGPIFITENNNGDAVVSDFDIYSGTVVVTKCGGIQHYFYTGHPFGSGIWPCGLCTDALSHILVYDYLTQTVQMLDEYGQFLSHLLIRPSGIFSPHILSYDVNTHRLLVGSWDHNKIYVYNYLSRQEALKGNWILLS